VSELAPTSIRTSIGEISAIFALDGWVMLEAGGRSTQSQCRRPKELSDRLVSLGVPADEAGDVAHELWRQRPGDASMQSDSQSVVMSIGNQWVAAAVVLSGLAAFAIFVGFHLAHRFTGH
jgi:hypothetical protein